MTTRTTYIDILVDGRFYAQYRYRHQGNTIDYPVLRMKLLDRYPSLAYKAPNPCKNKTPQIPLFWQTKLIY